MLKIVLVNAPPLFINEPWFDTPDFPRTSLAFLAAYLREYSSCEVYCIDAKFERLSFDQTIEKVFKHNPDIVGFSAFTNEINPCAYLAGLVKMRNPRVHTVIGGPHATAIPKQTLKEFPNFDYCVVGEGEITLTELVSAIANNTILEAISGLVYRKNGKIIINPPRERILNQDSLPMPAWDLFPPAKEYFIQTERGCPFNCIFCMNHNGRVARKRSPEKVMEEMEWLIAYAKPKRISFGDELFSVDVERAKRIIDLMIEKGVGQKVSWDIQTHVGYVDDELFKKMKAANIAKCEMGVETGDDRTLRKMGKGTTKKQIIHAFLLAHKYHIKTGSFLIIGHPNETYRSIWNTIKLGIQINATEPIIGTMVPYPGTEVAKMAAAGEGGYKLISQNWDDYGKQLNGSLQLINISRLGLDMAQMIGYTLIFLLNFRINDFIKFFIAYRTAAFNLLKKTIFFRSSVSDFVAPPYKYYEIINSKYSTTADDIIDAREIWKKYQNEETGRTRKLLPILIEEQMTL